MADISRVNRPISEAGPYYSRLAPWYDWIAASEKKFIQIGVELLDPQPDERMLEIGFGTGYAQILIADRMGSGFSAGLDLSEGMGRAARRRIARSAAPDRIGLVCSDTLPIPFPENCFEGVFTSFTLELFDTPDLPRVLAEIRRVLIPGGRLVVVSLTKDQPLPWMGRLYEVFHNRFPTLADCRPIPAQQLVKDAGFSVHSSRERMMWGLPVGILLAKNKSS